MAYVAKPKKLSRAAALSAAFDATQIARAVRFAAHFRKGPGEAYTIEAATAEEARAAAAELDRQHGQYGRRAAVYAITPEGVSFPIPPR